MSTTQPQARQVHVRRAARTARPAPRFPENLCGLTGPASDAIAPPHAGAAASGTDDSGPALARLDQADAAFLARQYFVARTAYIDSEGLSPGSRNDLLLRSDLGWAGCELQIGNYDVAESIYEVTATLGMYPKLTPVQAAFVFLQLGTVALDAGDALFRDEQLDAALAQYTKVITVDDTVPTSDLYTIPQLQPTVAGATKVIENLPALLAGQATSRSLDVNPQIAGLILSAHQQIIKLANGLDFWGHPATSIPIWTFDYLQNAAINFTQLAITAERDFINFQERSDQGSATRQQLAQLVSQADGEVAAAKAQAAATAAEATAYATGVDLAKQRSADAAANAVEYAKQSALSVQFQALQVSLSGGDFSDIDTIQSNADILQQQGYIFGGAHRPVGQQAGGASLVAGMANREYEIDSMMRTVGEMDIAQKQAGEEAAAARARVAAANAGTAVATLHAEAAQQNLAAFDTQTFTPDVWQRMADAMWRLYRRYLDMAIKTSLLMQRAYNFETDQSLRFIKKDYSSDEVKGLLGAESLMADIQSFTYDLITSTIGKAQPVRQTISLSQRYAYLFENQFRRTGVMEFETRIDDFDRVYPGTYAGRLQSIEVELIGLVPPAGVSGTLTNSGISGYRTPASAASPGSSGLKYRIQPKETLVLSDYAARADGGLIPLDQRMNGIFQGSGVVSSWRLEVPKEVNDIDYGALLDVRITFFYKARYDPDLHDRVLAELASRNGINQRQRGMPLRWLYPDAFFQFQDSGTLKFSQRAVDFAANETQPVTTAVGVIVTTDGSVSPQGLVVHLTTPSKVETPGVADVNGLIDSSVAGNPWSALVGGSALGEYMLTMSAQENPGLVRAGNLDLSPIVNIALVLGYSFVPKGSSTPVGPPIQI